MKFKTIIFFLSIFSILSVGNNSAQTSKNSVPDSIHRSMQMSFLPFVGTDGASSNKVSCNTSLNILAGSIHDVNCLELGGLVNIVRRNAGMCQLAGIGNIVGGKTSGFQSAGIFNQSSQAEGIQMAGIVNNTKKITGIQMAGVVNNTLYSHSTQLAGIVNNVQQGNSNQFAGVANRTDSSNVQLAGIVNCANNINGLQMAGVVNIAKKIKGVQIGIINIADSCSGISIGLINLIKNGIHQMEIYGDELFYANIAFRSGTKEFHTILTAGARPENFEKSLWTYGGGFGTTFSFSKKTALDIDVLSSHVVKGTNFGQDFLYKAVVSLDHKIGARTSIVVGLSYNLLAMDTDNVNYADDYSSIAHYHFTNHTYSDGYNLKSWLGMKVGLRFF